MSTLPDPLVGDSLRKSSISMSVDRVFDVLELLCQHPSGLSQRDIAERLGMPKSSASGLLGTMVKRQYLHIDPQRKLYFLGVMTYRLGSAYSDSNELEVVARPVMSEIQRLTGEVVNVSVMQGRQVVLVGRIHSSFPLRVVPHLGAQTPAHASAAGKAILACLDETELTLMFKGQSLEVLTPKTLNSLEALREALLAVRASGVAFDDEESHEGIAAVGTAILGANGEPVGGLSLVLPAPRLVDAAKRERMAALVRLGGRLVSQTQGYLAAIQEKHSLEHLGRLWDHGAAA